MDYNSLKPWATARQCEIIDAVDAHGTQLKAAKALGITPRSLQRSLKSARKRAAKHGWSPDHDMIYPAPDTHLVKGVSTLYGPTGLVKQQWVKTDIKKDQLSEALHQAAAELCETLPKYEPKPSPFELTSEALTAYVIGDAHIGMRVTAGANGGNGDWNLKVAEDITLGALDKLIGVSGGTDVGLLVDCGDWMHNNDSSSLTQSGNVLDMDGDLTEVVTTTVRIYRQAIDMMLDKHREVVVMMVRGNHNRDAALFLNIMLMAVYENEPRVTILDNRDKTTFYEYGANFLGFHHGDRIKPDQLYQYFTSVYAEAWGRTKHRHCFLGHVHHFSAKEIGQMIFETYNTIAPSDSWHHNANYRSKRSMTAIVFDKDNGEVQRHKVGIDGL